MFKKNSIEFFIGLQPYLYYYYSGCTLESHGYMSESPPYLYPYSIVYFEVLD